MAAKKNTKSKSAAANLDLKKALLSIVEYVGCDYDLESGEQIDQLVDQLNDIYPSLGNWFLDEYNTEEATKERALNKLSPKERKLLGL